MALMFADDAPVQLVQEHNVELQLRLAAEVAQVAAEDGFVQKSAI